MATRSTAAGTTGVWLAVSHVLGRPVPVDGPYPHLCNRPVTGTVTGREFVTRRDDCAACQTARHRRRAANPTDPVSGRDHRPHN
jgi:hypothetical protein